MKFVFRSALALCALAGPALGAETPNVTPYQVLHQVLRPAQQIARYDRLVAIERIESKLPGVRPQDIRITVQAKKGPIVVPVAADGRVDFPLDDALVAENPDVLSNQPKGSLTLTVTFALKLGADLRIPWDTFEAAMDQARKVVAEQAKEQGGGVRLGGAQFVFSTGSDASVTVAGKGERLLMADDLGHVIVMVDETMQKEQPALVLSRKAELVLPFLQQ